MDAALGDEPEHRGADREDVGAPVDLEALHLLGRHVGDGAERRARPRVHRLGRALAHAGDAEVEHLEPPVLLDEEVVELDVAVDDALVVRRREHVEQLVGEAE